MCHFALSQDLHALAGALMEHETLTLSDIQAVLAGDFQRPPPGASGRQQPKAGQEDDEEGQKSGVHEPAGADLDSLEAQKVLSAMPLLAGVSGRDT